MEFDHLIVAGPRLPELTAACHAHTGVVADPGGRHLGNGTHNALVGWGPARYLELLAIDPEQAGGPFAEGIAHLPAPTPHTWCARAGSAEAIAARIEGAGLRPRRMPLSRLRPDGVVLTWELLFVDGHAYGPLVPFFIDWGEAPHPAGSLRAQLQVDRLRLAHPDAAGLRALLQELGGVPPELEVVTGGRPRLEAHLRGPAGVWVPGGVA
jgi:hypothetical protein